MESIKNVLGLGGSTTQSGQEPVSGVTGSGTAEQPYDAGNAQGESRLTKNLLCMNNLQKFPKCNFKKFDDGM